jgi:NADH-quinone oxidoreductase subunit G
MIHIQINDFDFLIKKEISILEACKYLGIIIPRFCYHEILSVSGNCRMCLIELEGSEKPVASCVTEAVDDMQIFVDSTYVKKARENVLETLLLNHPLDCPICDQAGECDLQDQSKTFGGEYSRFFFNKRGVEDKNCGPLIKTIMTRCIHCTRCVRFSSEVAGINFLGTLNRGTSTEIGVYTSKFFQSEISGTVIDLCPVGALTAKPYAFKSRPWDLRICSSIDLFDSLGSSIYIHFKENEIYRILPKIDSLFNNGIISDKIRFSYDYLKNNRIKTIYESNKPEFNYNKINWNLFLSKMDKIIEKKFSIALVFTPEIDFLTLNLIKKIFNKYKNKVKFYNLYKPNLIKNFFIQKSNSSLESINNSGNFCYLISINPRIENAVLNAKLRLKYNNELLAIFIFNQKFNYNIPSNFLNLNIKTIFDLWESKSSFSSYLITDISPLFIISENLNKRVSNLNTILNFIKKLFSSNALLFVGNFSNTEGLAYLNVKSFNLKQLKNSNEIFCLNLDDLIFTRKKFELNKNLFWFNSHGSKFASKCKFILPICTNFETEELHINLEQRIQKSNKVFDLFFESKKLHSILLAIFNDKKLIKLKKSKNFDYLLEIIKYPNNYKFLNKNLIELFFFNKIEKNVSLISTYPTKQNTEDFYLKNKNTKNSSIMIECSYEFKKIANNFLS